jgi:hypothetical protein
MAPVRLPETAVKIDDRKLSSLGATEDLMDIRGALAQRIDRKGTKIEDLAGTGEIDSSGG